MRNVGARETAWVLVPRADQRATNGGIACAHNLARLRKFRHAFVFQRATDHEKVRLCWNRLWRKVFKINSGSRDDVHARGGNVGQHLKRCKFIAVNLILKEHGIAGRK